MKRVRLWLAIGAGLVVLTGVLVASLIDLPIPGGQEMSSEEGIVLTEITLAGLLTPEEEIKAKPTLKQKPEYQTNEPLALRVVTAPQVRDPVELIVRLTDAGGQTFVLAPANIVLQPGTATFCCWRIAEPGDYTLQIFRPERTVTTLPIRVRKSFSDEGGLSF